MEAPTQASQPSVLENERPHEPESEFPDPNRDTQENFLRVPWIDIVNELRSVQQSCRQLRIQVEGITSNTDTSDIVARQEALSRRLLRIEDGVSTLVQDQDRAAETSRECQAKADLRLAQIELVNNRIRTRVWYHDLSDMMRLIR